MPNFSEKFQRDWIEKNIDDSFLNYVNKLGLFLCDKDNENQNLGYNAITVTQLRNIFSEAKRIEQQMFNVERKPKDSVFAKLEEEEKNEFKKTLI